MVGFVDEYGQYHKERVPVGILPDSSQFKAWSHDRQRAEHQWELLQPYKNGKPNPDFIEAYPEESKVNGMRWQETR